MWTIRAPESDYERVSGGTLGGHVLKTAEQLPPADATAPRGASWAEIRLVRRTRVEPTRKKGAGSHGARRLSNQQASGGGPFFLKGTGTEGGSIKRTPMALGHKRKIVFS